MKTDASRRARITIAAAEQHTATEKDAFLWDGAVPDLALRAYPTGKKVWIYQYRAAEGPQRRVKLGPCGAVDLAEARKRALALSAQVGDKRDPEGERRERVAVVRRQRQEKDRHAKRGGARFGDVVERYLAQYKASVRASTFDQTQRNLRKYAKSFHDRELASVDRADVSTLRESLTGSAGPIQANRVLTSLVGLFYWCADAGLLPMGVNPASMRKKSRNEETARTRVLSDDELRDIWAATDRRDSKGRRVEFDRIVRLLMLTGARRGEIGGLRWAEVGKEKIVIEAARMKRGGAHEIPLTDDMQAELPARDPTDREYVFGETDAGFKGWSKSKSQLDRRIALAKIASDLAGEARDEALKAVLAAQPHWGLHDLRRTVATRLHEAGVAPHVVEDILAHAGARTGVAGVYNRANYLEPKRIALAQWGRALARIVGNQYVVDGIIIPFLERRTV